MNEGTAPAASDDSEEPIGSLAGAFPELASLSDADIAELHQSLEDQVRLPFDAAIPNAVTQRTFAETDAGENIVRCDDAQDTFTQLGI
jgi:DNA-damage-inducible protein J